MSYGDRDELLFCKYDNFGVVESQKGEIKKAAAALSEGRLRGEPLDVLAEELANRFTIDVPSLDEAGITVSPPREVDIEVGGRGFDYGYSGTRTVKGTTVTFRVPYQGDKILFSVRPSTFNLAPPHATIRDGALEMTFSGPTLNSAQVKSEFEAALKSIKEYLGWQERDFSQFNASVKQLTFAALN